MHKPAVHLFHIGYSMETMAMLAPGFQFLDNLDNERPDWFESWPIRDYLNKHVLDEDAYYGFFSPRFFLKTGRTANDLREFIALQEPGVEAFIVCPQAEVGAFFLNPVYGMDFADAGALNTTQKLLDKSGMDLNVSTMLIDSTELSYSNYVIGKPSYWRRWLELVECAYRFADGDEDAELKRELNKPTAYNQGVQRKVFFIECVPTLVFHHHQLKVKSIPVNQELAGKGIMYPYVEKANQCDALKNAFRRTGEFQYMQDFQQLANTVLSNFARSTPAD